VFVCVFCCHFYHCFIIVCLLVRAVNLASVCPFTLGSIVAYGLRDYPHRPSLPAKKPAQSSQADMRSDRTLQPAVSSKVGSLDSCYDAVAVNPAQHSLPAAQQISVGQQLEPVTQSTWQSHIPMSCGKYSPLFITVLFNAVNFLLLSVLCCSWLCTAAGL